MKVLYLSAEVAPFTKVGGLGDVAGSLPAALRRANPELDVRVVTPLHGGARKRVTGALEKVVTKTIAHAIGAVEASLLRTTQGGVPVYFVSSPVIDESGPVYHADASWDAQRFVHFSLAALELSVAAGFVPDVVHCNDWHTAPAVAAVHRARDVGSTGIGRARTVLTVHNLPFVGHGAGPAMRAAGLVPPELPLVPREGRELPLPIALSLADRIVAVSPRYAGEIQGAEFGVGLDALLRSRRDRLSGILNGIDVAAWDPANDPLLEAPFSVDELEGRGDCKRALQRALSLPEDDVPLIAVVSRLTAQKGIDAVPDALHELAFHHDFQAVILGTGDAALQDRLLRLGGELGDRVRVRIAFDEALSHRIYAGADLLAIPSRYEPCGLTQMIAMRYGCVPVARDTGGLGDTVHDLDLTDEATGFVFPVASSRSLAFGLRRAVATWLRPWRFRVVQEHGMRTDFSWARAAAEHAALYELATTNRVTTTGAIDA